MGFYWGDEKNKMARIDGWRRLAGYFLVGAAALQICACRVLPDHSPNDPKVHFLLGPPLERPTSVTQKACDAVTETLEKTVAAGKQKDGFFRLRDVGMRSATVDFVHRGEGPVLACNVVIDSYAISVGLRGDLRAQAAHQVLAIIRKTHSTEIEWRLTGLGETIILSTRPEDEERTEGFLRAEMFTQ
jgi:hypothetical protein